MVVPGSTEVFFRFLSEGMLGNASAVQVFGARQVTLAENLILPSLPSQVASDVFPKSVTSPSVSKQV